MATQGPWGLVGDDLVVADEPMTEGNDRTSGSSPSHGPPPPPPPAAACEVLPPAPGIAEHLALQGAPCFTIWCSAPCHWCSLKVSEVDHGNLHKAHEAYVALLADSLANATTPTESKTIYVNAMKLVLMACAWHTKRCNDSPANQEAFKQLQGLGWLPPDDFPSTPGMGCGSASACAAEPAEQAASSGTAGSSKKKKPKTRRWWEDDIEAEWRKEPWVTHDVERRRTIKVLLDGKKWEELDDEVVQTLLKWYDKGRLFDVKKGVMNKKIERAYDYRIEGGKHLTQNNPNYPESNPRHCQILYVEAAVPESTWTPEQDNGWWS